MDDPIVKIVKEDGIRAILIEPNPDAFTVLKKTYEGFSNVMLIQAAIAEKDGDAIDGVSLPCKKCV